MKLGLGTVQFGLDYGISNCSGRTPSSEVRQILEFASTSGLRILDTAALYGSSEEVLGNMLWPGHAFDFVTKTPKFNRQEITSADVAKLEEIYLASLQKLRAQSCYGLLIHDADDLLAPNGSRLMDKLAEFKGRGLVKKIGVSVYDPRQVEEVMEKFPIDMIQVPLNVLDQRLVDGGQLARLKRAGVEIHVRSSFLQGLLLMPPSDLPEYFTPLRQHLQLYHDDLNKGGFSPLAAALAFVVGLPEVDAVVCGVNNLEQMKEVYEAASSSVDLDFAKYAISEEAFLNPSLWRY